MAATITLPTLGPRARAVVIATAATALAIAVAGPALQARPTLAVDPAASPDHTISVTGTGRVTLAPDVADLRLGVSISRPTVKAARADAANAMTAVIAALKKLGIADADIQTSGINLQPQYDYSNNTTPRVTGYTFSNGVAVTVRKLELLGDAIDGSLAAGATSLDSVSFRVDDETKAEAQARTAAMADAKAKADALAGAARVNITGVASIAETVTPIPYPVYYGMAAGAAAPDKAVSTPVQAGTNDVSVTVSVVYLIP
jgi:uncharacterized protein YggE